MQASHIPQQDDGMTLVEVLVALTVLLVAFAALAGSSITALKGLQHYKAQSRATTYGQQVMERFRTVPWTDLVDMSIDPATGRQRRAVRLPLPAHVVQGAPLRTDMRVATPSWLDDPANGCQTPATIDNGRDYLQLQLEVRWTDRAGRQRVTTLRSFRTPTRSEQAPALGAPSLSACPVPL